MRIIGIDPGLRNTGWGIIELKSNRLVHVDDGRISPPSVSSVGERLLFLKNKCINVSSETIFKVLLTLNEYKNSHDNLNK